MKSIKCQCFDLGYIQVVLYLSAIPEQGIDDAEAVLCTLAEEEQAVVNNLAYSVSAQNAFPVPVVLSHPRIKVSKFVARWGWADDISLNCS